MDAKAWFSEASGQRITDERVAKALDVTRKTANKRLNDGLEAGDVIVLAQSFHVNPVMALVELGHVPYDDVTNYLDSNGQLVATAEDGDLALELARRLNPATRAHEIDELAAKRDVRGVPYDDGTVVEWDESVPHAADSSPDERFEREERGEDPID